MTVSQIFDSFECVQTGILCEPVVVALLFCTSVSLQCQGCLLNANKCMCLFFLENIPLSGRLRIRATRVLDWYPQYELALCKSPFAPIQVIYDSIEHCKSLSIEPQNVLYTP